MPRVKGDGQYTVITYEVEDGYVGGSRPHSVKISNDDLDEYETESEIEAFIEECVQEDFEQNVSWTITRREGKYA